MSTSTAEEMAYFANRPQKIVYKAKLNTEILECGHNPWIYARKVSNLRIHTNNDENTELIQWKEPPFFSEENGKPIKKEGQNECLKRKIIFPLDRILRKDD